MSGIAFRVKPQNGEVWVATYRSNLLTNADLRVAEVRRWCRPDAAAQSLLRAAMRQLQLRPAGTRRGYYRMLELARTIADPAGSDDIRAAHVAEALQHRPRRVE